SWPPPGAPFPCLLVHHRRHLSLVGELLSQDLLPISSPVLLPTEIDAPADQWIGVEVNWLPVHNTGDELVRRQPLHRRQALRRVSNSDLKSRRSEQIFLLRCLLLRTNARRDTEHHTCPS